MDFDIDGSHPKTFGFASVRVPFWYRGRIKALCSALVTIWPDLKLARTKGWITDHYITYGPNIANGVLLTYIESHGDDGVLPATVAAVYLQALQQHEAKRRRSKTKRLNGRLEE